jgi:hypothetical protein
MSERKSPSKSATLYKIGIKKKGNDGNTWIIVADKNNVKRWSLYKKVSKKSSKKVYRTVSKKYAEKRNSKKVYIKDITDHKSIFNQQDYGVLEIIKSYKSIYELIMNKSLEYKIELTPQNAILDETTVEYFKKNQYNTGSVLKSAMHIIGYLEGNTFIWNDNFRHAYKDTFLRTVAPSITNVNTLLTLSKLFSQQQLTFPEKFRQTIPYLLSYMYDPSKANIIRFAGDAYSNQHFTYIFMAMSLEIPYWYEITGNIINEFNNIELEGGSLTKFTGNYRLLKDDPLGHVIKKYSKLHKFIK